MWYATMWYATMFAFLALGRSVKIDVTPEKSIQDAIEKAQPGDTIVLGDGNYAQDFQSVRDGTPEKRITITGSRQAVVNGESNSRMIQINHSYMTLDGFTVSGVTNGGKKSEDYVDKCVYILGTKTPAVIRKDGMEYESSLDGMVVSNMRIADCGGECLRLRSFITNAEVVGNKIEGCGRHDFKFPSSTVNGEAIYVGTSSNQWSDGKNSKAGPDLTKFVWIHENEIDSQGNECVDVKEGTTDVLVEYNVCSDQRDENSAGLDSRTDDIIFRYNEVVNCAGAGVRIGGHTIDGRVYGVNNEVYGNVFSDTKYSSVKIETGVDHNLCDNECKGGCSTRGSLGKSFPDLEGSCPDLRNIAWTTPGKASAPEQQDSDSQEDEVLVKVKKSNQNLRALDVENVDTSSCTPAKIKTSSASDHDGNPPHNAVDGSAVTRWSAKGKGAWLSIELSEKKILGSVEMSFYQGDSRIQFFDVYGDGNPLLLESKSSGKSTKLQSFPFKKPTSLKTVTIFGNGNSDDDWNSITEIMLCSEDESPDKHDDPSGEEDECDTFELEIEAVKASADDGNKASNLLGKDLKTRWSCNVSPCDVTITLKQPSYVAELEFAVYEGADREQQFDVEVKKKAGWERVVADASSQKMKGIQSVDIDVDEVTEIKFIGYGNDKNNWTSLVSLGAIGC